MEELVKRIFAEAARLGACAKFTGTENLEQLVRLLFSPQGIEFCQENRFPDLPTWRRFIPFGIEKYGVYIDAGTIALHNPGQVMLVGDTQAALAYDNNTLRHEVILMHGAEATIDAKGWAVVFVIADDDCRVTENAAETAKIL